MADLIGPFDTFPWSQTEWYQAAGTWAPSGIIGPVSTSISTGGFATSSTGLSLSVAIGRAWVHGSGFAPVSTTAKSVTTNANASLSRRDRLVIRRDLAAQTVALVVLQGTPASTPTAPALTQSETGVWEISVCSFLVPPNNGTTLTGFVDERAWTDADGLGLKFWTTAARDAHLPAPADGVSVWGGADNVYYDRISGVWLPRRASQAGAVAFSMTSTSLATGTVTFPTVFPNNPAVSLGVQVATGSNVTLVAMMTDFPSTTGFPFRIREASATNVTVTGFLHWVAYV